ncbi:hypothetical protein ZIOFF_024731 [Zingiber officinale]|uniref:Acyl-CoA oxidase C-alpha1 domain-containing protein n=1 Tax=Zingiber officinale TaxID=94328 RepID=A0A8J5GYN6_ZINOF|nr:hypothetical protein ZIOFF_024731 [Zingiber officinale]
MATISTNRSARAHSSSPSPESNPSDSPLLLVFSEEEASVFRIFIDDPGYGDLHWWWPGGLGKVSTHAVVYARLIIDGKYYGINGFVVQLRSLDDHSPLPGIVVGDIGMKFGNGAYNTMENGVLHFDHVRIPQNQMLVRVSQVTREGKYVQSDVPRQFGTQDGSSETQVQYQYSVIDYKTQQSRLFPLLASAYAFRFVGQWLKWLYNDVTERLRANDILARLRTVEILSFQE